MEVLTRLACVAIGYAFGCIQFAYIFGKARNGIDIRDYGSGNSGTTNAIRVLGFKWGMATLICDVAKAALAVTVAGLIFGFSQKQLMLWSGVGVVIGHNHPFYMQFKGGKGVAAMIGIYLVTDLRMTLIAAVPALILLAVFRYMSLGSITGMAMLIVLSIVFYHGAPHGLEVILLTVVLAGSVIIRHRGNIKRLINGTERKLGEKAAGVPDAGKKK